ncbi:Protein of unknown function [Palleronia marisminoris]|uniref:DUF1499 domain-containing protein n=1 Tax=Palleronia marisminoris TaxID=315423 RepID=A0A1Y5T820_9RHOB|nr:DUF1499 domain-containing protein [Palleronia marisminoris]SFH22132.1 Protein of unknown function [Palleronia marisminoris]SLN57694.1 hypothetical protein PAM7066_02792 [Palleronia marisminoris]
MLKIAAIIAIVTALAALGVAIWVRNISVPVARYHERFEVLQEDRLSQGGFVAVRPTDDEGFARLVEVIATSPRTTSLAGRVEEGHVSFVTRTRVMGFPDVTNVTRTERGLAIRGHLVVGKGDMGVNRRRIEGWLAEAGLS